MAGHTKIGFEPLHTYEEISAVLGVSRERVRQIEKKALRKLRVALVVRGHNSKILDAYEPDAPSAEGFVYG